MKMEIIMSNNNSNVINDIDNNNDYTVINNRIVRNDYQYSRTSCNTAKKRNLF